MAYYRTPTFIALMVTVLACLVSAQSSDIDPLDKVRPSITLPELSKSQAGRILLDRKIDPKTYTLGPGDILSVFTWGNFQGQYRLTVSPEGMLLIPEVGPVDVSGITLEAAGKKISASILRRFRNVETIVSLVDLRVFKVYVGGAVNIPGAYPATAVTRVSEVIELAGSFLGGKKSHANFASQLSVSKLSRKRSSKRDVNIIRQNGDILRADILRFEITTDTRYNPRLQDGDVIFVPLQDRGINLYGIFGAVKNAGYFEYSERDSLSDLLGLAHGLKLNADSQDVEIVRFLPDNKKTFSLYVDLTSGDWNIPLEPDDRVYIKGIQDYHEKHQVRLKGEFEYPGYYAIKPDSTRLSELVERAGGFTDMASLHEAEISRVSAEEIIDPEFERLKKMQVADMSESEYEYFKIKSRSKPGHVAVDFPGLFTAKDTTRDLILRDGDIIRVPRKSKVVSVIGEASNPGILPHKPGADYDYYIKQAGGFSDRARKGKVSIIKGITGEWKKAKKGRPLEPGDTVWIPETKKFDYWGFIKDTLVFAGNLATVYLVIQQATK